MNAADAWRARVKPATNPPNPLHMESGSARALVDPPSLIVVPTQAAADLVASKLAAAEGLSTDRSAPPPVVALEATVDLHVAVGNLKLGDCVVLFDEAQVIGGDLDAQGIIVRDRTTPYPAIGIEEHVQGLVSRGTPDEIVAEFLWHEIEDAVTTERRLLPLQTRHPNTPRIGQTSPIVAAWKPTPAGALSMAPPPREYLVRHVTRDGKPTAPGEGDGVIAMAIVALFVSAGGVGKSMCLAQLAVAIVTATLWLATFEIDRNARGKRVLLACAEEDVFELRRRIFEICRALELSEADRTLVEQRVQLLGLAGQQCGLVQRNGTGSLEPSPVLLSLHRQLHQHAGAEGWAAVILDPLSRFAGAAEIDTNNSEATTLIALAESLATVPGNPAVILAAHSSKTSRREDDVDVRGATALVDGCRWAASLRTVGEFVELKQIKSNYSRPWSAPVKLARLSGGTLRALSDAETESIAAAAQNRAQSELRRLAVVATSVVRDLGTAEGKQVVAAQLGVRLAEGRRAVALALSNEWIRNTGTATRPRLVATEIGIQVVRATPPVTPGTSGRRPAAGAAAASPVPDENRTSPDDGTRRASGC